METRPHTAHIFNHFAAESDDLIIAAEVGSIFIVNDDLTRAQRVLQDRVLAWT
ncbi:MAG: hypothetical protein ACOC4E_02345 [Patescibacteria group bacterium]